MQRTLVLLGFCAAYLFCFSGNPSAEPSPPGDSVFVDTSIKVDVAPLLITSVKADYPDSLIAKGIEGTVVLDLLIDSTGLVDSGSVVRGCHPVLDSAALKAVQRFRFSPAMKDSQPVPVILRYACKFSIDEQVQKITNTVNLAGVVYEKGTKRPISNGLVAIIFTDTNTKISAKKKKNQPHIDSLPGGLPLSRYLKTIGAFPGQRYEQGQLLTQTDSLGRFSFSAVPCGTITLKTVAMGHRVQAEKVVIKPGQLTKVVLYLSNDHYNENEIIVYGKTKNIEVEHLAIATEEIKRVPGFNGEAVQVVQALPGVARSSFGKQDIIVRGADNDDSKILFDGIELPYLYHEATFDFGMYRSIINSDALKAVTFYPGGMGVRYGNVLGGVVDLASRPARTDRLHTTLDINLKGYTFLVESPLAKGLSAIGSFRGNLFTYTMDLISEHITHDPITYLQDNFDYLLRFDYAPSKTHQLFIESIGAKDTITDLQSTWITGRALAKDEIPYTFGRKFYQGIGGWNWAMNSNLRNELRLGIRTQHLMNDNNMVEGWSQEQHASETTYDLRDEIIKDFSPRFSVTAGLDIHATPGTLNNSYTIGDTTYYNTIRGTLGHYSAYLSSTWKPVERLTLTPGLRFDRYPQLKYHGAMVPEFWNYRFFENTTRFSGDPSARVSARYELDNKEAIKASAGTYSQSPDSMLLAVGRAYNVSSEKGSQYTLGYERQLSDLLSLDVEGYFNQQWDLFRWTTAEERMPDPATATNPVYWKCDGRARMTGLEIMARRAMGPRFFGWLAYSLGYSQRYDFHEKKWLLYDYNVLNNVQAVGQWSLPLENSVGLRLSYTEGYPYTPQMVQFYDATYFYYASKSGGINSKRYPPYVGLDLTYSKKWVFKKSIMTTYIEFIRVLHWLQYVKNSKGDPVYQPFELNAYNYDYSRFEGQSAFPMISFGMRWEF